MISITFFHLPNITTDEQETVLRLSNVGHATFINNGTLNIYSRLRNIELTELELLFPTKVWTFPPQREDQTQDQYFAEITPLGKQAFADLALGTIKAIWLSESGFTSRLAKQLEYQAL